MPTYPLKCNKCGHIVDVFRSVHERNDPYPCKCGEQMVQDYSRKKTSSTPFFEGTYIFEDGKKKELATKNACTEHAKKNNLVMGGDDMEQQAIKNRKDGMEAEQQQVADSVIEGLHRQKSAITK